MRFLPGLGLFSITGALYSILVIPLFLSDVTIYTAIVGGQSYGQGSSREHAALCPMYLGVRAVIAKSIERIHKANLINFAIVPIEFADEKDYDSIDQKERE